MMAKIELISFLRNAWLAALGQVERSICLQQTIVAKTSFHRLRQDELDLDSRSLAANRLGTAVIRNQKSGVGKPLSKVQ
jgi:hypothetical protein